MATHRQYRAVLLVDLVKPLGNLESSQFRIDVLLQVNELTHSLGTNAAIYVRMQFNLW